MKVSLNAIRAFNLRYGCAPEPAPDGVDALLRRIGDQLAAVEETQAIGEKYAGIVIVRVIECRKHENSDHLNVCLIDDGGTVADVARNDAGLVQVVCGAPNVRAGLTVAWLPPGATVPSSFDDDPFVLSVRDIRGETSNGMLASPRELAIGDSHDGILEINEDIEPGTSFAEHYNLVGDIVIDMENKMFTHRPDLFGMLGVAREIAGIQGQKFTSPDWYLQRVPTDIYENFKVAPEERPGSELPLTIAVEDAKQVPRLIAVTLKDIAVKSSPVWLQVELSRLGARPINNIVDITNYVMLLTGQPLHAYDYDKVSSQHLEARSAQAGEALTLLNGKVMQLDTADMVITDGKKPIGLAGVMGGQDTEVSAETRNVILECATFDMYTIRRTSMRHGIFSDAVTRFTKGQSPAQNDVVANFAVAMLLELAGGSLQAVHDTAYQRSGTGSGVDVGVEFVNERLGLQLSKDQMVRLLENVEFEVEPDIGGETEMCISVPFWRTDIEIPEDIVEEVGRLYGFDKLPLNLPLRSLAPATRNATFELQAQLRERLSRSGANEVLSYSFVDGALLEKSGQTMDIAYKLSNALSPDLQYYRLSLTPSLLEKVHANIKAGYDEFVLYEIGKAHATTEVDEAGLPREFDRLALVFAAEAKYASVRYPGAAYYKARKYLQTLLGDETGYSFVALHDADFSGHALSEQMTAPFDPARSAAIWNGSYYVGVVGEYKPSVQKALKLPKYSAGFEIFLSFLAIQSPAVYVPQPRFPKVWQDICLRMNSSVSYKQLHELVKSTLEAAQPVGTLTSLEPIDIYQKSDDTENKQITFRYSVASYDKTMTDNEVSAILDNVAAAAAEQFGAVKV